MNPDIEKHNLDQAKAILAASGIQFYVYRWDRQGRKGQICIVKARGKLNSCLVEFKDGFRMVTSRNAIRKVATTGARYDEGI